MPGNLRSAGVNSFSPPYRMHMGSNAIEALFGESGGNKRMRRLQLIEGGQGATKPNY